MQIDINNVTMIYPSGKKALSDVSFTAQSPDFVGILGPNGAGKSTLMKLMTAGLKQTKGEILVDDKKLLDQENDFKRRLGYLPQNFGLFEELTVWQFLDYMAALKNIKKKDEIEWALENTGLKDKRKVRIGSLSGGQKQRVGIAQAIMGQPEIMILDEPTVGLDPEERVRFRNAFSEMSSNRIVFLSTHIVDDVQAVCNRVLVIYGGKILYDGAPADLIEESLDMDALAEIMHEAPGFKEGAPGQKDSGEKNGPCLAVARDEAFCFYYEENLRMLKSAGIRIKEFSPLHDSCVPEEADGLLLGGGYPELYAAELSSNTTMTGSIRDAIEAGMPSLAECGGFMYLLEELVDKDGKVFSMAGAIKGKSSWTGKLSRFGYAEVSGTTEDTLLSGLSIKAHEFHYFDRILGMHTCRQRSYLGVSASMVSFMS